MEFAIKCNNETNTNWVKTARVGFKTTIVLMCIHDLGSFE